MTARLLGPAFAVIVSAAFPMLGTPPTFAQPFPIQLPGPLGDLLAHPSQWLVDTFNQIIAEVGRRTTSDVLDFMNWLLNSGNVVSQTPPALTYDSEVVRHLWRTMVLVANAGLAAVAAWGGINAMIGRHVRAPYNGVLEVFPRLVLSAILINTSLAWGHFVIDLNNALCGSVGSAGIPAWSAAGGEPNGTNVLLGLVALGIYLIMGLLLFAQMLMRIALLDVLLIVGPLALLCWALPQTYGWARVWFTSFFATVFVQLVQVLVLHLGAELITHLPKVFGSGTNPIDAGRLWLATLLLGMAVLQLARKIPRLMPGYETGAVLTHDSPMSLIRSVQHLLPVGSSGRRNR